MVGCTLPGSRGDAGQRELRAMPVENKEVYKQFGLDPVAAHAVLGDLSSAVRRLNERRVGAREAIRELLASQTFGQAVGQRRIQV